MLSTRNASRSIPQKKRVYKSLWFLKHLLNKIILHCKHPFSVFCCCKEKVLVRRKVEGPVFSVYNRCYDLQNNKKNVNRRFLDSFFSNLFKGIGLDLLRNDWTINQRANLNWINQQKIEKKKVTGTPSKLRFKYYLKF